MRQPALRFAAWAFSWLGPRSERAALLGDLAEEFEVRASTASSAAACRWYLRQMCASIAPLLWSRFTRSAWIATGGTALLAYFAIAIVEFTVHWVRAGSFVNANHAYDPMGMIITFPLVVLIGYFAAQLRRAAPLVLGAIMLLNVTAMMLWATETAPAWYTIAYFIVGPAATLIGAAFSWQRAAGPSAR
jgi:hypothetical protein